MSNIAPLLDRNRAFAADAAARQDMPATGGGVGLRPPAVTFKVSAGTTGD